MFQIVSTAARIARVLPAAAARMAPRADRMFCSASKPSILRLHTEDPRMSKVVVHNGTCYLSGQVGANFDANVEDQTRETLAKIDDLLQSAGTSRANLLSANIWLKDIEKDFVGMSQVWNDWVDPENKPTRATVESAMARSDILVEIQVTAAVHTPAAVHVTQFLPDVMGVPAPGAFSRAVIHNGLVHVSGTGAGNDTGGQYLEDGSAVFDETKAALQNVARILDAAGSSTDKILSATMLLTDRADYAEANKAYIEFFKQEVGEQAPLPARATALWGVPTTAKVAFSVVASTT